MTNHLPVIDSFTELDLSKYPEFLRLAYQAGLKDMKMAQEIRSTTIKYYAGFAGEITLRTRPELFPEAMKRILSFFVIALALSQNQAFKISWGYGGFLNLQFQFMTLSRTYQDANGYQELADFYYREALAHPELLSQ